MSRYEWTDAEPSNEYVRFTSIMEVSFGSKDIRVVLDDYSPDLVGVVYVNGEKYYEMDYDDDDVAICDLEDKVDELKRVNKMKFNDMIKQRRYGIRKSDGEATTLGSTLNVEEVKRFIIEKVPDEVEHMEEDWGDGWDSLWESRRH